MACYQLFSYPQEQFSPLHVVRQNLPAIGEDIVSKHQVTSGNIVPSRELLAEMLIVLKQPGQALAEFERSLKRDPNRFRAIYGAAPPVPQLPPATAQQPQITTGSYRP